MEVNLGGGLCMDYLLDLSLNVTYTTPISGNWRLGGGAAYDVFGLTGGIVGSSGVPYGFSFFADIRHQKQMSNTTSFVAVLDCGAFVLGDGGARWGGHISPQVGWSFRLSEKRNTAFNTRFFYKHLPNFAVHELGLMVGFSF